MFAQGLSSFFTFFVSSRCLYSACVLLIISSFALSTLPCVHLCPNKCTLPLSMTLFKHSRFLCCSMPSFGVSTTSPKMSSLFNVTILFIKCRNRHHMKNNIRYKGNINNTSVIIFLKRALGLFWWLSLLLRRTQQNSQRCYFAWENLQKVFVMLVVVVVALPHRRLLHFRATFPCHWHSTPPSQARKCLHRQWALPWLLLVALLLPDFSVTVLPRALRFWVGTFYPQVFFTLRSFTDILGTLWLRGGQGHPIQDPH